MNVSRFPALFAILLIACSSSRADPVKGIEPQPFLAAVQTLLEAGESLGARIGGHERVASLARGGDAKAVEEVQRLLDASVLFTVHITPEMRVKATPGAAERVLEEAGWRAFLVKVVNEAGCTAKLRATSEQAKPVFDGVGRDSRSRPNQKPLPEPAAPRETRWLDLKLFEGPPGNPALSGLGLEYRIVQLYSRDAGKREAKVAFDVGQGTQDLGFRNEAERALRLPARARDHAARLRDENGAPCIGVAPDSRPRRTRLSLAGQAGRAGLRLSSADLPRRWRKAPSARWRLHDHFPARPGIAAGNAHREGGRRRSRSCASR